MAIALFFETQRHRGHGGPQRGAHERILLPISDRNVILELV